ncbi:hypothetical protein, partial [Citreimonas sp.]|uniref:hypothetical protein n=1 Tax=Citreimonas sp. TaxID=3036715 RepID=UPI0035C7EA70
MNDATEKHTEKVFCNRCKGRTNHFVRTEHSLEDRDERLGTSLSSRYWVVECCGCENVAFVKKTHFSENVDTLEDAKSGRPYQEAIWDEEIYPPATYRTSPTWLDDLPDATLRQISDEIYKSLLTGSHFLAAFGSRTLGSGCIDCRCAAWFTARKT